MAEPRSADPHRPGLREALLLGALVVVAVLAAAAVTSVAPDSARDVVFRTPLLILVLIGGTALVLWRITRPARTDSSRRSGRPAGPAEPGRPER